MVKTDLGNSLRHEANDGKVAASDLLTSVQGRKQEDYYISKMILNYFNYVLGGSIDRIL